MQCLWEFVGLFCFLKKERKENDFVPNMLFEQKTCVLPHTFLLIGSFFSLEHICGITVAKL